MRGVRLPFGIFIPGYFDPGGGHGSKKPVIHSLSEPMAVQNGVSAIVIEGYRLGLKEDIPAIFVLPEFMHIEFHLDHYSSPNLPKW